jgi:hypothetical protein
MDFTEERRHDLLVQAGLLGGGHPEGGLEEIEIGDGAARGLDVGGADVPLSARRGDVPQADPGMVWQHRGGVDGGAGPDPKVVSEAGALEHDRGGGDVAAPPTWHPVSTHDGDTSVRSPMPTVNAGRASPPTERTTAPANTIASSPISIRGPLLSMTTPWST